MSPDAAPRARRTDARGLIPRRELPDLLAEFDYLDPEVGRSAIDEHLWKLVDVGVLERTELPPGQRSRDLPYTFYSLTDEARARFDRNDIFDSDAWRKQYAKVEKTPEIERVEAMPRTDRA